MALTQVPGNMLTGTTPSWTTAGRPASPVAGQQGYTSTLGNMEYYNGSAWVSVTASPYGIEMLLIGAGGSGGLGGGGAGGYIAATGVLVVPATAYSVVIGAGGSGQTDTRGFAGNDGGNSTALGYTALGGGGGGAYGDQGAAVRNGRAGGSGGGGGGLFTNQTAAPGGAGTSGPADHGRCPDDAPDDAPDSPPAWPGGHLLWR